MLRICIPVHNEATTIGVLLWRLRTVFQGFSREYDVVVYDDASTDGTVDVLEPYQSVMPLTVLRGASHRGYASSIDALVRHVAADDEYARRDAMVLMQGDFTESPEHLPELVKRFEGGADLVAVHRTISAATPRDERRLRRWGRWAVSPFLRMPPVADPFTGFRLVRISVLRDLLKSLGNRPVSAGEGWAANIDFALNVTPFARRIENVEFAPRYDVRQRASRRRGWPDVLALFHWARSARSTVRPSPGSRPGPDAPGRPEAAPTLPPIADRPRNRPPERAERTERGGRNDRDGSARTAGRDDRAARADERQPREARGAREERALRGEERSARPERQPRPPRAERPERTDRPERAEPVSTTARPARPARPPRQERQPRPERVAEAEETAVPDDVTAADELALSVTSLPASESAADQDAELDTRASAKRPRRRRRKARRDRGSDGDSPDGSRAVASSGGDGDTASDDSEGDLADDPSDGSGDDADGDGPASRAGGETTARRRRPRRRRRGRRPGGADSGGTDGVAPPAAEPPTA